jgi:protein-S-isoprenylcysteine O-methyltransferase Ste14
MIVYPLQWLLVIIIPKHIAEKTGQPTDLKLDRKGKTIGSLTSIFWIIASLYSIFLPLQTGTAWLYTGLALFIIGVIIVVSATLNVYHTAVDAPFTGSIYRFSRHPMYLSMFFVYTGVSIAAASWLFLLITVITFFLQRFQAIQEEGYCLKKYGAAYREYMDKTPRWIGIPKTA